MIYNADAARKLIGCLFNNAQLLNSEKYVLTKADFEPQEWHLRLYQAASYLSKHGAKTITALDLYSVTEKNPSIRELFDANSTKDFIDVIKQLVNVDNVDVYYEDVKKCSILRAYQSAGFDVSRFENEVNKYSLKEIVDFFDGLQIKIKKEFYKDKNVIERHAGDGLEEIKEQLKLTPSYGATTFSESLNTATRGWVRGQLTMASCVSGSGKTTLGLMQLAMVCCPEMWDEKSGSFVPNKCYQRHGGLFIQYELDPKNELEMKLLGSVSGVPTYHILNGRYAASEETRVDRAIEILHDANLFTVLLPNPTIEAIGELVRDYVINHDVAYVVYDYVSDSSSVSTEIAKKRGAQTRGDQVMQEFTAGLKNIARENNVGLLTFSQTNSNTYTEEIRNESCVAGGRAAQNALDVGMVISPLNKKEQDVAQMVIDGGCNCQMPNRVICLYKCRFGEHEKDIKIWCHVDLNTGHVADCFTTDKFNSPYTLDKTKLYYKE